MGPSSSPREPKGCSEVIGQPVLKLSAVGKSFDYEKYLRLMDAQNKRLAYLSGLSTKSSGASLTGIASNGTLTDMNEYI